MYILIVSSMHGHDRGYMMPWYSNFYIFDSLAEAEEMYQKFLSGPDGYDDDQLYIKEV